KQTGHFLREAHVQLIHPAIAGAVAAGNLAAMRAEVTIVRDVVLELLDLLGCGAAIADFRVIDSRDVEGILIDDTVTVDVTGEYPAVRQAIVAAIEAGDRRLVVAEERMLPGERGLEHPRDVAVGGAGNF